MLVKRLHLGAALLVAAIPVQSSELAWPLQPAVMGTAAQGGILTPPLLPALAPIDEGAIAGADAATVDALLSAAGLKVTEIRSGASLVPRLYAAALPADMAAIDQAAERKRIFIKVMLPLVLSANERLAAERAKILRLRAAIESGGSPDVAAARWLALRFDLFGVESGDFDELLARVDTIPPSLALAQAAQESGWGTSRFAREGNALFGQKTWEEGGGIEPAAATGFEVRSFNGLKDSVFAYLVNLNSHPAYESLRRLRAELRATGREPDGATLAAGLDGYAEEPGYVEKIRALIAANRLTDFDGARLAEFQ